jgi:DNA-binding IclR family transcriptional regulator
MRGSGNQQGVQSVEVGARLLKAIGAASAPLMLKQLAAAARMPPAKAHRYLVSLARCGLVEQKPSGLYDLGPFAMQLGLSAMARLSPVSVAEPFLEELQIEIGQTVALAVWGDHGPVIVRWLGVETPVGAALRVGSIMPVSRSATGLAFLSFLPDQTTAALVKHELAENRRAGRKPANRDELAAMIEETRRRGCAFTSDFIQGIAGIAAPAFDHAHVVTLGLVALGYTEPFSADRVRIESAVLRTARLVSQRLGWQ